MPTRERLLALRADAFADDVEVTAEMEAWTEEACVEWFETGGANVVGASSTSEAPLHRRRPGQPFRILSLHGGGSMAKINTMQTTRLRRALGMDTHTIEYLEGTRRYPDDELDPGMKKMFGDGPYYNWYGVANDASSSQNSGDYVQKMLDPTVTFTYTEVDPALDRLEGHIDAAEAAGQPFDVLLGFSQGCIMISMLTERRLRRQRAGTAAPPSWLLNVFIAGLPPRWGPATAMPPPPQPTIPFPCVATMGTDDRFYEWGKHIKSLYGPHLEFLEHGGSHEAPKDEAVNASIAAAVRRALGL